MSKLLKVNLKILFLFEIIDRKRWTWIGHGDFHQVQCNEGEFGSFLWSIENGGMNYGLVIVLGCGEF